MKVVVDTNVLVSGALSRGSPPGDVLRAILEGRVVVLFDERITAEYADVLSRPKFPFAPEDVDALLRLIVQTGMRVAAGPLPLVMPDPADVPFAEVAYSGQADALITGNTRHFPIHDLVRVVTPREWLSLWSKT